MKNILSFVNPFKVISEVRALSVRQAFIDPISSFFKLLPANSPEHKRTKASRKYRIVAGLCIISLLLSGYLIYHKRTYTQEFFASFKIIPSGINEIFKDFPMRIYSYMHFWYSLRDDFTQTEFRVASLDEEFTAKVSQLILIDRNSGFSELGGMVFLDNGKMNFVVIESKFLTVANEIDAILKKNKNLRHAYDKYEGLILNTFKYDKVFMNFAVKAKRWMDRDLSSLAPVKKFLEISLITFREYYAINEDSMMEQFYGGYRGDYVGNFHIHRYGSEPSVNDLETSKYEDKFVIISQGSKKFQIAWLRKGKIYMKSNQFFNE